MYAAAMCVHMYVLVCVCGCHVYTHVYWFRYVEFCVHRCLVCAWVCIGLCVRCVVVMYARVYWFWCVDSVHSCHACVHVWAVSCMCVLVEFLCILLPCVHMCVYCLRQARHSQELCLTLGGRGSAQESPLGAAIFLRAGSGGLSPGLPERQVQGGWQCPALHVLPSWLLLRGTRLSHHCPPGAAVVAPGPLSCVVPCLTCG